ncbi:MAG: PDZ domain-containing protein [Phycisphaerae bacterium]|nr:PDZ domain-containing protein [Phycisphaerae bacterium]
MKKNLYIGFLFLTTISGFVLATTDKPQPPVSEHAYLGVFVDTEEITPLLAKHLQLKEGQGLVLVNIIKDSPADKAGLEKDDIILSFQGEIILSYPQFHNAIFMQKPGNIVTIDIIHNGQRKSINAKLIPKPSRKNFDPDSWKYPFKPRRVETWEPGVVYPIAPKTGLRSLTPVKRHEIPAEILDLVKRKSRYISQKDGHQIVVEINGDIRNPESIVNVAIDRKTYVNKVDKIIEDIPQDYQQMVKECLDTESKRIQNLVYNKTVMPTMITIEVDGNLDREEMIKEQISIIRQQMQQMADAHKNTKTDSKILKDSFDSWQKKLNELENKLKEIQQQNKTEQKTETK